MNTLEKAAEAASSKLAQAEDNLEACVRAAAEAKAARDLAGDAGDRKAIKNAREVHEIAEDELAAAQRAKEAARLASVKANAALAEAQIAEAGRQTAAALLEEQERIRRPLRKRLELLDEANRLLFEAQSEFNKYAIAVHNSPSREAKFWSTSRYQTSPPDMPRTLDDVCQFVESERGLERHIITSVPGLNGFDATAVAKIDRVFEERALARGASDRGRPDTSALTEEQKAGLLYVLTSPRAMGAVVDLRLESVAFNELAATAGVPGWADPRPRSPTRAR